MVVIILNERVIGAINLKMEKFRAEFKSPGAKWRGKLFWSWNGELEKKELLRQIDILKEMGMGGYFMHSICHP
jgi:hypothetical protein